LPESNFLKIRLESLMLLHGDERVNGGVDCQTFIQGVTVGCYDGC